MLKPSHALPQRSASELFTDREDHRARFGRALDDVQALDVYRVVTWYGVGGQGKSALQAEFGRMLERARGQWVNARGRRLASGLVDLENPANRNPAQALLSLRLQLAEHGGLTFPAFDLAFARYFSLDQPGKDIRATHPELFRAGSEVLSDVLGLAEDVANVIPGYAFLTKYGAKLAARGAEAMQTWWDRRGRALLVGIDELSIDQLAGALPKYLGYDLCEAMAADRGPRVVIRFDTHEALWRDRGLKDGPGALLADDWLRRLVQDTPGAVVIITGRDKLRWGEIDAAWDEVLEQHLLGGLSHADATEFLTRAGISDAAIRDRMIAAAAGEPGEGALPYYLDLERETHDAIVARGVTPSPNQFGGGRAEILARFLAHLDPETERRLRLASYPETLDPESLAVLSRDFLKEPDTEGWKRFLARAFVEHSADGPPSLHRLTRATLQASEREDHWDRFKLIHWSFHEDARHRLSPDTAPVSSDDEQHLKTALAHYIALGSPRVIQWTLDRLQRFQDAARSRTVEAVADRLRVLAEGQPGMDLSFASILTWQAVAAADLGRLPEAEALYRQGLAVFQEHLPPDSPQTLATLGNLAGTLIDQDQFGEAEALYRQSLEGERRVHGDDHPAVAVVLSNLAMTCLYQGRFAQAGELLDQALGIYVRALGLTDYRTATTQLGVASMMIDLGRYDEASDLIDTASATLEAAFDPDHPRVWNARTFQVSLLTEREEYEAAIAIWPSVLQGLEARLGASHPWTISARRGFATALRGHGRFEEARRMGEELLTEIDLQGSGRSIEAAQIHRGLAEALIALGQDGPAGMHLQTAREILETKWAADHPHWSLIWLVEAKLAARQGDIAAALSRLAEVDQVLDALGTPPEHTPRREATDLRASLTP
ncbi:MAG: tetratricopeptide repeat protein [Caulobacterales bacterium]|nr:tetratricopeptide repeat protein [Caulobacterales bacterium]